MSMRNLKPIFAWLIVGFVLASALLQAIYFLPRQIPANTDQAAYSLFIGLVIALLLVSATFAAVGALIVTRMSGNLVGWLLLIVAINFAIPTASILEIFFPSAPATISPGLWLLLWLSNWTWLLTILPVFLIMLNFPTGHTPSRRWRWLNGLAPIMILYWALTSAFINEIGPEDGLWQIENPIGVFSEDSIVIIAIPFYLALLILAFGSVSALFVRSRRSGGIERQQIKWLLYSGALCLFALGILLWLYSSNLENSPLAFGPLLLVLISFLSLPISIGIAILRYRLYDIDIIVRRTLSYSILTAALALVYFGGVVVLQNIFGGLFGSRESPLITVISTLAIAALFNPLRRRTQEFIDRRFFRSKYDAEKALADFAVTARDEVDMDHLIAEVLGLIVDTMQPENLSLWLRRQDHSEREIPG